MKLFFRLVTFSIFISATAQAVENDNLNWKLLGAAKGEDPRLVRELIAEGADVNFHTFGNTPLMFAARRGQEAIVQELISAGADMNMADSAGWTALMLAISDNKLEVARLLIDKMVALFAQPETLQKYPLTQKQMKEVIVLMDSFKKKKSGKDMAILVGKELKRLLQVKNMLTNQIERAADKNALLKQQLLNYLNKQVWVDLGVEKKPVTIKAPPVLPPSASEVIRPSDLE